MTGDIAYWLSFNHIFLAGDKELLFLIWIFLILGRNFHSIIEECLFLLENILFYTIILSKQFYLVFGSQLVMRGTFTIFYLVIAKHLQRVFRMPTIFYPISILLIVRPFEWMLNFIILPSMLHLILLLILIKIFTRLSELVLSLLSIGILSE